MDIPRVQSYRPPPNKNYTNYTVKKGDTLQNILTKKLGFSDKDAKESVLRLEKNGKDPDQIKPGQVISTFLLEIGGRRVSIRDPKE